MGKDLFCDKCNRQLQSIDEIERGLCNSCRESISKNSNIGDFFCWSCKKALKTKKEIAQGVCDNCKAYIIRILK